MIVSSRLFDPVTVVNYVDYIESTGTQHIDTGIQASSVLRVVCDISGFPKSKHSQAVFGGRTSANSADLFGFLAAQDLGAYRADYGAVKSAYAADYSGRFTIDMNRNVTTCTDGPTVTATTAQFTSTNHIFLFAYNTNGSPQNRATGVRLYSCKIYENDELVRDFRPCLNSEGEACLYDKITKAYFHNAGTGSFTAG